MFAELGVKLMGRNDTMQIVIQIDVTLKKTGANSEKIIRLQGAITEWLRLWTCDQTVAGSILGLKLLAKHPYLYAPTNQAVQPPEQSGVDKLVTEESAAVDDCECNCQRLCRLACGIRFLGREYRVSYGDCYCLPKAVKDYTGLA